MPIRKEILVVIISIAVIAIVILLVQGGIFDKKTRQAASESEIQKAKISASAPGESLLEDESLKEALKGLSAPTD